MIEKTGDRTFCTKCGQKVAECRCEEISNHHSPNCPSMKGKPVCTCGHLRRYGNDDDSGEKKEKIEGIIYSQLYGYLTTSQIKDLAIAIDRELKPPSDNMVPCKECRGGGESVYGGNVCTCSNCNGTGKVKKEIDIDDEIDNALDKCKDNNDSGEKMTYEDCIKKYFPRTYANKDKVCIYCHQEIRGEKNEYEEPKPEITEEYCTFKNGVCIFKRNITEATLAGWIEEFFGMVEGCDIRFDDETKYYDFGELARFLKEKGV